jgi:hypothetical protein
MWVSRSGTFEVRASLVLALFISRLWLPGYLLWRRLPTRGRGLFACVKLGRHTAHMVVSSQILLCSIAFMGSAVWFCVARLRPYNPMTRLGFKARKPRRRLLQALDVRFWPKADTGAERLDRVGASFDQKRTPHRPDPWSIGFGYVTIV